jgi:hypothetical protein
MTLGSSNQKSETISRSFFYLCGHLLRAKTPDLSSSKTAKWAARGA